jgi:hypothetical protein
MSYVAPPNGSARSPMAGFGAGFPFHAQQPGYGAPYPGSPTMGGQGIGSGGVGQPPPLMPMAGGGPGSGGLGGGMGRGIPSPATNSFENMMSSGNPSLPSSTLPSYESMLSQGQQGLPTYESMVVYGQQGFGQQGVPNNESMIAYPSAGMYNGLSADTYQGRVKGARPPERTKVTRKKVSCCAGRQDSEDGSYQSGGYRRSRGCC